MKENLKTTKYKSINYKKQIRISSFKLSEIYQIQTDSESDLILTINKIDKLYV